MKAAGDKLPRTGPAREALRERGQFWTPDWVAEAMVGYVLAGGSNHLYDPAVGAGAFFRATKSLAPQLGRKVKLLGSELHRDVLLQGLAHGLSESDLSSVRLGDFVFDPPPAKFKAIVANPPYIRHHRIPTTLKNKLKALGKSAMGKSLDGRAGFHIYFLIRALQLLEENGRLAFIMPADTCEGVFSSTLWSWIAKNYRLEAVVTFSPEASPFPEVDTNPIIFMIRNASPSDVFYWAKCLKPETSELKAWTISQFLEGVGTDVSVQRRKLSEALATGLSRAAHDKRTELARLGDYAKVLRGIATGANQYFYLTRRQAMALGIPREYLIPAIGRTRDIDGEEITPQTIEILEARGRPTLLFSLDSTPINQLPRSVQAYLDLGQSLGLPAKPLIASRRPWYKMETRVAPPIMFAYLGRRNVRFVRNLAGVVPLTGFLCVYPRSSNVDFVEKLWRVLNHPQTIANLRLVGKSYGSGAIKVEPRALERLPIPPTVLSEIGMGLPDKREQLSLAYSA